MARGESNLLYDKPIFSKRSPARPETIDLKNPGILFYQRGEKVFLLDQKGQKIDPLAQEIKAGNFPFEETSPPSTSRGTLATIRPSEDESRRSIIAVEKDDFSFFLETSAQGDRKDLCLQALEDSILLFNKKEKTLYSYPLPQETLSQGGPATLGSHLWQTYENPVPFFAPGEGGALFAQEGERGLEAVWIDPLGKQYPFLFWGDNKIKEDLSSMIHTPAPEPGTLYIAYSDRLMFLDTKNLSSSTFAHLPAKAVRAVSRGQYLALSHEKGFTLFLEEKKILEESIGKVDDLVLTENSLLLLQEDKVRVYPLAINK